MPTGRGLRALWAAALLGAGCALGLPAEQFGDLPVPPVWRPYSREWVLIQTPQVTAAKLIWYAETDVDTTLAQARELLTRNGWTEVRSERFVNPEKFPGVWAEFAKGEDVCRVTVIEGPAATHVDYTVARRTSPRS